MPNKKLHADPKSYAPFVALRYNATKGTKLFGLVIKALGDVRFSGLCYLWKFAKNFLIGSNKRSIQILC